MNKIKEDKDYQALQYIFSQMGRIAREAVYLQVGHFVTGIIPHEQILFKQIWNGDDLKVFKTPVWVSFLKALGIVIRCFCVLKKKINNDEKIGRLFHTFFCVDNQVN